MLTAISLGAAVSALVLLRRRAAPDAARVAGEAASTA
jgi:hypothetical protein